LVHKQNNGVSETREQLLRVLPVMDGFVVDNRATDMMSLRRSKRWTEGAVGQYGDATALKNESERVPESRVRGHNDYLSHTSASTDPIQQIVRSGPRHLRSAHCGGSNGRYPDFRQ
jgi:hypothetical protein